MSIHAELAKHGLSRMLLLGAVLWLSALSCTAQSGLPFHRAMRSDDFVETIGVATHWGYNDTPYGFAYENVKALLAASGIRYVRDGMNVRLTDLYHSHGIRSTIVAGPGVARDTVALLKQNRDLIAMVEGPNEVALFPQSAAYQGQTFPEGPRRWMTDLYQAIKAEPDTRSIGVVALSTGRSGMNVPLSPLSAFDYCVMHSYAGGNPPATSLYSEINNNIADAYAILEEGAMLKPLVVTESGYHTALGSNVVIGGAQPGVSERAQAKYLPRQFAEYFNAGIVRTYAYELIDEFPDYTSDEREATNAEACFGLIKRDLKPKPAYFALKNLIGLLSESHWDASRQQWVRPSPAFSPRALRYELSGNTANVHQTLLQKADGDYYLLLWQETSSFDLTRRTDITFPEASLRLSLARPATFTVYHPGESIRPVRASDVNASSLDVSVPDEVIVVRIAFPTQTTASQSPPPLPLAVNSSSGRDSITIAWKDKVGPRPQALFISRLGKMVAELDPAKQNGFTEKNLLPGKGYSYQLVGCDAFGNLSAPINLLIQTRAEYPDLIITEVGTEPDPINGRPVRLTATIKNIGNAPTAEGVVHGVAFSIDGQVVCWSDDFKGPLKPGESHKVTSNNGPAGSAEWTSRAGKHTLRAIADDVNRLLEKTHSNNTKEKSVTIPEATGAR